MIREKLIERALVTDIRQEYIPNADRGFTEVTITLRLDGVRPLGLDDTLGRRVKIKVDW